MELQLRLDVKKTSFQMILIFELDEKKVDLYPHINFLFVLFSKQKNWGGLGQVQGLNI